MDVWIDFGNASKWQAEALFWNFFPSTDDINDVLEGVELLGPSPQSPVSLHPLVDVPLLLFIVHGSIKLASPQRGGT
jgi:hypothetical protein